MNTVEAIRVRERPILFSAAMVAAILDNRKSQTRRVIKPQPPEGFSDPIPASNSGWFWIKGYGPNGEEWPDAANGLSCPHGHPGEHLWVKEAWQAVADLDKLSPSQIAEQCLEAGYDRVWCPVQYADGKRNEYWQREDVPGRKRNALHMPRWASRITLEIVEVRVEQLQDISEDDAKAEGVGTAVWPRLHGVDEMDAVSLCEPMRACYRNAFATLWDSINAKRGYSWDTNPFIWCISFRRVD